MIITQANKSGVGKSGHNQTKDDANQIFAWLLCNKL